MPFITIAESPLSPGVSPVEIYYREFGNGIPLLFLHGGWGYEIYPFGNQVRALGDRFRILIPDRTGYGSSGRIDRVPIDFHARAARETIRLLDALEIDRAVLWGHSDGAVISSLMGLESPDRFPAIILEAFHFYGKKPSSRQFFETMAMNPEGFGERVSRTLALDHGEDYWRQLIVMNGTAWLRIGDSSPHDKTDLYGGRLSGLEPPVMFIHGSDDPRTEPGELEDAAAQLPEAELRIIIDGGHSPHSKAMTAGECSRRADDFLTRALNPGPR